MKIDEIQDAINQTLSPCIEEFKYKKSDFEYTRRNKGIAHIFRIYLHAKTDWINVVSAVFVGSSEINKLFNEALGRNLPVNGITWGYGISNLHEGRGSYSVECIEDIKPIVSKLKLDFDEVAIPEFDKAKTLQEIERKLNRRDATGKYHPESVSNACLGIAAAHLIDNPDFSQICEDYYSFCKQAQTAEIAAPIIRIKDYCLSPKC